MIIPHALGEQSRSSAPGKSIIIIGGGISGLAAGCYAQMNGYHSTIYEMHSKPGGCCTSWNRGEYTFDWCISWLLGSGRGNEMSQVWEELGALDQMPVQHFEVFNTVLGTDGEAIRFYSCPDRLESHLLEISPDDARLIKEFCADIRQFKKTIGYYPFLKPMRLMKPWEKLKLYGSLLPYMRLFMRTSGRKMDEYANGFKHPLLREAMRYIFYERHEEFPVLPYCFNLACAADFNAGVPLRGSMGLAESIEKHYLQLGGTIRYNTRIKKILVQDGEAIGVQLPDDRVVHADKVIGACDGYSIIYDMLNGAYSSKAIDKVYQGMRQDPDRTLFPGVVSLFLGVNREFKDQPEFATLLLNQDEKGLLPGMKYDGISVQIRNKLYPHCAPKGHSVLYITYLSDYKTWSDLNEGAPQVKRQDRFPTVRKRTEVYKRAKEMLVKNLIDIIDRRYLPIQDCIEKMDLSTPLTSARYTGNMRGSILGWPPFSQQEETLQKEFSRTRHSLPGLKNFYMAGQWTSMGGLVKAAASGRHVIQYICQDDQRAFRVSPNGKGVSRALF